MPQTYPVCQPETGCTSACPSINCFGPNATATTQGTMGLCQNLYPKSVRIWASRDYQLPVNMRAGWRIADREPWLQMEERSNNEFWVRRSATVWGDCVPPHAPGYCRVGWKWSDDWFLGGRLLWQTPHGLQWECYVTAAGSPSTTPVPGVTAWTGWIYNGLIAKTAPREIWLLTIVPTSELPPPSDCTPASITGIVQSPDPANLGDSVRLSLQGTIPADAVVSWSFLNTQDIGQGGISVVGTSKERSPVIKAAANITGIQVDVQDSCGLVHYPAGTGYAFVPLNLTNIGTSQPPGYVPPSSDPQVGIPSNGAGIVANMTSTSMGLVKVGETTQVLATVKNIGQAPISAGSTNVVFGVDGAPLGSARIPSALSPGMEITANMPVQIIATGEAKVSAQVVGSGQSESSEQSSLTLMGWDEPAGQAPWWNALNKPEYQLLLVGGVAAVALYVAFSASRE